MCCVARVPEAVVSVTCTARLQACQSLASLLLSSHLIFLSLMRFSLSRFFSALTNWLKKCSWSFFLSTCLKRWSLPYFSENSLKVDLGGEENFIFNWIEIKEHQCRSRWCEGAIWTLSAPPPWKKIKQVCVQDSTAGLYQADFCFDTDCFYVCEWPRKRAPLQWKGESAIFLLGSAETSHKGQDERKIHATANAALSYATIPPMQPSILG